MTELRQVYKCEICGNILEVVHNSAGTLVCCGKPMKLVSENTVDASKEKHIPVIEKIDGGIIVKVGSAEHPMLENHYVEWIEAHTEKEVYRKFLKPGDKPEALFKLDDTVKSVKAYCNLHGLWINNNI